jgi:tRNA A-37 threonylcarbamoyl transferase component Bud32
MRIATAQGQLRLWTHSPAAVEPATALAQALARAGERRGEALDFDDQRAYLKGGPLTGKAAVRHGLRAALLRQPPPRLKEAANLRWLRSHEFQVPPPLVAGLLSRGGLPRYQFLVTRWVDGARTLDRVLDEDTPEERRPILEELAREVARMHASGFVHRDLFPRNLLALGPESQRRVFFLDAWAGGPGTGRRGPAYDLACLFLEADRLEPEEQRALLETYCATRLAEGRPVPGRLMTRVVRNRRGLLRRLALEPARLRGRPMPGPWTPPRL